MQYSVENLHLCPLPFLAVCRYFARLGSSARGHSPAGARRSPDPAPSAARISTVFLVYIPTYWGEVFVHIAQKFLRFGKQMDKAGKW